MPKLILAQALKKRKLSKRQFAKRLGMQYPHVFRFFTNGYNPTFKTICAWAKAIPCRVRDLIDE